MRGLHWFRNDLRLSDNTALNQLAARAEQWLPVCVLDPRLLGSTPRTRFWLEGLARLAHELERRGVPLLVREGRPEDVLPKLLHETKAELLSFNAGATPFSRRRDAELARVLEKTGATLLTPRDDVIFASPEVRTGSGGPYSVYTPYRNAWRKRFREEPRTPARLKRLPPPIPGFGGEALPEPVVDPALELPTAGEEAAKRRLGAFLAHTAARYHEDRDLPAVDGTSRLSPYLRFGMLSVRQCFARAEEAITAEPRVQKGADKWLDELIWREFYAAILEEHPRVQR